MKSMFLLSYTNMLQQQKSVLYCEIETFQYREICNATHVPCTDKDLQRYLNSL